MTALLELITVREMREEDKPFILSSWLKSHRAHCGWASSGDFFNVHRRVAEGLLARSKVFLAVQKDDPSAIVGWSCLDRDDKHVHYVYVKRAFRRCGVAATLVGGYARGAALATHQPVPELADKLRSAGWRINPAMAFYLGLAEQ
jgi:GNAT superfamily N-acetyltransferase